MSKKARIVAIQGEEVEFYLPNGLTVWVWAGTLEEGNLNIRASDAVVIQPVSPNRVIVRKRE